MPQGPPPHRSLLSVRSHSKGARVPSGVFASLQGLLWPDFSGPHNSLRSPKGYCLQGEPLRLPEAGRIHQEPLLKLGEAQGEEAEETAGPSSRTAFLWRRQGPFPGTHPCMHSVQASQPPAHPEQPLGTTPQSSTYRAPMRSATPSFHKHTGVHTHMWRAHTGQELGSLWGARQGGFSAVVAQEVGKVRPLLWERPCEDDGWGWVTGAQPQGNNLPGHLALLVPSRQCLPPVPPEQHLRGGWGIL